MGCPRISSRFHCPICRRGCFGLRSSRCGRLRVHRACPGIFRMRSPARSIHPEVYSQDDAESSAMSAVRQATAAGGTLSRPWSPAHRVQGDGERSGYVADRRGRAAPRGYSDVESELILSPAPASMPSILDTRPRRSLMSLPSIPMSRCRLHRNARTAVPKAREAIVSASISILSAPAAVHSRQCTTGRNPA